MSDSSKAVFLSYASQDAGAAKGICDALRAAGVEVWFDAEGGLEHGDEWDAKIRRQIKECVLFLPIISANTQAREEGYFRIEWELAAQRALGIASGVAFILPIVIDDTREPDALVPDRFRSVQWTKLRGGELTPEVKARFLKLWSHRTGVLKHSADRKEMEPERPRSEALSPNPRPSRRFYAGLVAAVIVLVAGLIWGLRPAPGVGPASAPHDPPVDASAEVADRFPQDADLAKAMQLIEAIDSTVEDHRLAEDLVNAALALRPTDPEAVIMAAYVSNRFIVRGFDVSPERYAAARRFGERALALAPDQPEALHVMGMHLSLRRADPARAVQLLQRALELKPGRARFYDAYIGALGDTDPAAVLREAEAAVARFPTDVILRYRLALVHLVAGRWEDYERALDETLALSPFATANIRKAQLLLVFHENPIAAKRELEKVSGKFRLSDRMLFAQFMVAYASGDVADALRALDALPGQFVTDFAVWPKLLLRGDLLSRQGRPELARRAYEGALADIARERARDSGASVGLAEIWLLIRLERIEEARAMAGLLFTSARRPHRVGGLTHQAFGTISTLLMLGERPKAVELLREAVADEWGRRLLAGTFATNPDLAPWRDDPEIQALLGGPAGATVARDWPKIPELKQAIALTEGLEAVPDDLALAEEIAKRAVDRSPTDIEAVTVMARVQTHFLRRGFDRSDERAALAKRYSERALQLAPDEPEAMYALATYHFSRATGETARTEQLLRRAIELDPTNPRPGRLLADLFNATDRLAEAIAQGQDNIRRFPNDVLSHYDLARTYKDQGRYDAFDRALDATLALAPLPNAIVWKARLQFGLRNDFAGMKAWLDRVPARVRGTERAVFSYFLYAGLGGDPETGLAALRDFPDKWFTDFEYAGPTALLNASLLELQDKKELARRQYEVAQGEIQRMRQTDPGRIGLSQVEFWTLLGLGRTEEAKVSYRRMVEGTRRPYAQDMVNGWWFTTIPAALLIGDRTTALTLLRESVETRPQSRAAFRLRFQIDPRMAPFRDDPEIKALLKEPEPKK